MVCHSLEGVETHFTFLSWNHANYRGDLFDRATCSRCAVVFCMDWACQSGGVSPVELYLILVYFFIHKFIYAVHFIRNFPGYRVLLFPACIWNELLPAIPGITAGKFYFFTRGYEGATNFFLYHSWRSFSRSRVGRRALSLATSPGHKLDFSVPFYKTSNPK